MAREKNAPVGTSECPIKGCSEITNVYKYRSASDDASKRRFAGRLYCVCAVHGRVENQEFLLENIKWQEARNDGASTRQDAPSPAPKAPAPPVKANASPPAKSPEKHASAPVTTQQDQPKKASGWLPEFFK